MPDTKRQQHNLKSLTHNIPSATNQPSSPSNGCRALRFDQTTLRRVNLLHIRSLIPGVFSGDLSR